MFTRTQLYDANRKARVAAVQSALEEERRLKEERDNANFFEKVGYTALDVVTELGGGLFKTVEGVVDLGAGIAGEVGSWFGADTKWAEDFIKEDQAQKHYYSWEDKLTNKSQLNNWETGKEVVRGIGQQLPVIIGFVAGAAAAPATGGSSLAAATTFAKVWGGVTAASAGGQGMEESLNEGANFDQSFMYGLTQGGIELLIEGASAKLGIGTYGIGKSAGKSAAKSIGKTMLEEGLSEAFEEGTTALVNPLAKTIYKGEDALDVYGDMSFYLDAGHQALIGGLVGSITSGTGALVTQRRLGGNVQYMLVQSADEIKALDIKEQNLFNNGKLTKNAADTIERQRQVELENISLQLQRLSQDERLKVMKEHGLTEYFDSNGEILQSSDKTIIDEQNLNNAQNGARTPLISDNIQAYSPNLRKTKLILPPTSNAISAGAAQAKKFLSMLNPGVRMVITDAMPQGVNSFYDTDSKIYYFANNITAQELAGHEFTHSLEGTKEYKALADYVLSNVKDLDIVLANKIEQYKNVNTDAKSGDNGKQVALYEAQTEVVAEEMGKLLSDEKAINRIVNYNKGGVYRIWNWIKDVIAKFASGKQSNSEYYKFIRNAEKLYAKAIQTSYGGLKLSEVAAIEKFEQEAKLDKDGKLRYSKSNYSQYRTLAMQWAFNSKTKDGDVLALFDGENNSWKKLIADSSQDIGYVEKVTIKDSPENIDAINKLIEEVKNENKSQQQRNSEILYESINEYERIRGNNQNDNVNDKGIASNGRNGGVYQGKSESDGSRNNQQGGRNKRYSLKETVEQDVIEAFGKTYNWRETGYILQDGSKLDLSGRNQGAPGGSRQVDHREIFDIYEDGDTYGTDAMIEFMARGNIRVSPEYPGINLQVEPTDAQYEQIRSLIDRVAWNEKYFAVDFDNKNGDTIANLEYENNISANKIISDIKYYFKEGKLPYKSDLSQFRYSLSKDNKGNNLTKEQQEFFKNSKIRVKEVDGWAETISDDGQLFRVYHGTNSDEFFEFNKRTIGSANDSGWFGKGFYFAFSKGEAATYGGNVLECYLNVENPYFFGESTQQGNSAKGDPYSDFGYFVINISKEFPALAKEMTVDIGYRNDNDEVRSVSFEKVAKMIEQVYNSPRLQIYKTNSVNNPGKNVYKWKFAANIDHIEMSGELKSYLKKLPNLSPYYIEYQHEQGLMSDKLFEEFQKIKEKYGTDDFNTVYLSVYEMFDKTEAEKYKMAMAIQYLREHQLNYLDLHMPHYFIENYAEEFTDAVRQKGYDGIIQTRKGDEIVVFEPNQIKLTTNKNPTASNDMRYSLKDGEGDYIYSKGQISKYVAEHSKVKAYLKSDAEKIVNSILSNHLAFGEKYGEVRGKTKEQVVSTLWHALNTKGEGYRMQTALDIADFIIDNAVVEDIYSDNDNYYDEFIVGKLSEYIRKVDLSGLNEEIRHKFDNKTASIYSTWGRRNGIKGSSPDQIAMELAESGIQLEANNSADILFEMNELYRKSKDRLKTVEKEKLNSILGTTQRHELKQAIARDILVGYDETGHKTKFEETIEKYTSKISELRAKVKDVNNYNKAKNGLISTIERLRDEFVKNKPAAWDIPQPVVDFVRTISKVETWRNNISKNARQYISQLSNKLDLIMDETQAEIYPYREVIADLGDITKGELTTEEFVQLDAVFRQFAWQLRHYDKVAFEGKVQTNSELAAQGVRETLQANGIVKDGTRVLSRFKNTVYVNPRARMAEMGLYRSDSIMLRLYNEMLRGDSRRAQFTQEASNLYDDFFKSNKKYLESLQTEINVGNITLTKRQAISLYMTSLREQGQLHLFNIDADTGVVRLLDNKLSTQGKNAEAFSKGKDVRITREMIAEIKEKLTNADKTYIELTHKFFNENSRNAKTEVDEQLYGITNVEDGNYFPLKVSNDKIYTQAGQVNTNTNQYILNLGINKSVKTDANNKLVIDGVDNIIANHVKEMSMYYGYAIPLTAYNRIMNKQIDSFEGADTTTNMRGEISKIDSTFEKYMNQLWKDIQGIGDKQRGFIDNALSYIRWAGSSSALGLNPKVLVTQTLSLAAAVAEFNPKYIAKGMGHFFGEKHKAELAKYSPLMWERMEQGHSVDVQEIRQIGKEVGSKFGKLSAKATKTLNDLTTKPISWMDSNVIQSIWFAAQYEVADTKGKGYEFGTEANKIEAGKRVDQVVFTTQQTSDPLGRSAWMRSKNEIVKFARMFTGDAIQLTGKLISSIDQLTIARKMIKSKDPQLVEQGQKLKKEAIKATTKAASAFVLNQSMLLAIAMAFKWIKGKDDDEEWSDIAKKEATANLMGLIPFGADMFEKWQGYEPTNMAYTALGDTVDVVQDMFEIMSSLITGDQQSEVARNAMIRKSVLSISRLLGIPTQNVESYVKGIVGKISPGTREEYEALFKTKSNKVYLEKIKQATAKGDEELADTLINIMFNSKTGKIKDDNVMEITRDLIEKGYDVVPKNLSDKITYNNTTYNLTKKQYNAFKIIYSQANNSIKTLVNNAYFKRLNDEAKAKAMRFIYDYYYDLAVEDLVGEDTDNKAILFANAIPIEQLALAAAYASVIEADKDKKGNSIIGTRKTKVQRYVQLLRLTAVQKYIIMGYLGYSNTNGSDSVWGYINRLNLSKDEKTKLYEKSGYTASK